jgi:hypothetical protein
MVGATVSSLPPTACEVDRDYHQLMEIHAIGAVQFIECARNTALTPPLARFGPGPVSGGPTGSHPQPKQRRHHQPAVTPRFHYGSLAPRLSPWHVGRTIRYVYDLNGARGAYVTIGTVNGGVLVATLGNAGRDDQKQNTWQRIFVPSREHDQPPPCHALWSGGSNIHIHFHIYISICPMLG